MLKSFNWSVLSRMYGCAHNSIIGFISAEWISQSEENSVLDGAPSPVIGKGRKGQKNADTLLCKGNLPFIVVEVETVVDKYEAKLDSLLQYIGNARNYLGIAFGLLFMSNLTTGTAKYRHNWEPIKDKVRKSGQNVALVSVEKEKSKLSDSVVDQLRKRNDYNSWEFSRIDYWVRDSTGKELSGTLWKKG